MTLELARGHLAKARRQWERAATASWAPAEPADCVTFVFYAYENAVVAVAEALGIRWEKNHAHKAALAGKLADDGIVRTDVEELLVMLNGLRKDISYGVPGPDLADIDLDALVTDLEHYLDDVTSVITRREDEVVDP